MAQVNVRLTCLILLPSVYNCLDIVLVPVVTDIQPLGSREQGAPIQTGFPNCGTKGQ